MLRLTYHNLARDPEIRDWVQHNIGEMLASVRKDRIVEEERWLHFWKIYNVELDPQQGYMGRTQMMFAAGRNVIETWKTATKRGLFPFSDPIGVEAKHGEGLEDNATAEKALQKENLRHMNLEDEIDTFLQQFYTYGTGVLRHGFEEEEELQRFFERRPVGTPEAEDETIITRETESAHDDEAIGFQTAQGTEVILVERPVKVKYGPTCRTVDLFHFFVSPTTARSVQEAELAFEDITTAIEHIEVQSEKWMDPKRHELGHLYEEIDELVETDGGRIPLDVENSELERGVREAFEKDPNVAFANLDEGFVNLSECYWRGEIPGATDPDTGEEYGVIDWMICLVNDQWAIRVHPNPRYRKRRPWHAARLVRVVNEFYGRGVCEPIASICYMMNDLGNLTMDNVVNSLNPIVLIDDEAVSNFDSLQLAPNAKWFVKPDGAAFITPPNVASIGTATIQMLMGFIQDYGGANFAVQGTPAPRGRGRAQNTASGMAMLAQSGSAGFSAALDILQRQLMIPIMESNYELQEQFMSDKMLLTIGGADGVPMIERRIGFEDVIGNYLFTWKAAQQIQERMSLMQGLQGILQLLVQVRSADPEAASQFRIKWGPIAKRILTDGLGLSWADEVIETPEDSKTIDPRLEGDLMAAHREVQVSPSDDDAAHMAQHQAALSAPRFANDLIAQSLLVAHLGAHAAQAQAKQAAQMQQQMMQMMQQMQGGQNGGGPPGMGSLPNPNAGGGTLGDLAQASGASAAASGQPTGIA